MTAAELEALAAKPQSASTGAGSATARSADDVLKLLDRADAVAATEDVNDNGGPKSPWHCLRMARASLPGVR